MKKIFLSMILMILAAVGFAQVKAQSFETTYKDGYFGLTYIHDGLKGQAAITINNLGYKDVFGVRGLNASTLVVNPRFNTEQNSYLGGLFTFRAYDKGGVKLDLGFGAKGLDITSLLNKGSTSSLNFNAARQGVFSIGLSVPVKSN